MRAAACGALPLSAWLEVILLRHHCRIKDWRYSQAARRQVCDFCFTVDDGACCVCCEGGGGRGRKGGGGACVGLKEARFEPPLLIADAVVQAMLIATLWTFSTRAAACGALPLSAWLDVILLRHHCRIKDWRYSQAARRQVCDFCFTVDDGACCVCCEGGGLGGGGRGTGGHALG
jgi:hypothetical protein